jgi:carboxylate-amine ligase
MAPLTTTPRFGIGPALAVGVEEELLAVDPDTLRLARFDPRAGRQPRCLGALTPGICDAVVELATPICTCAPEAVDALRLGRRDLQRAGVAAMAAGTHPAGAFGDVRSGPGARYAGQMRDLRGLLGRTPYCGMHVHVGMPDAEMAIRACNGLRKWVPLLIALGANSPFWHGCDSGLASARVALMRSLPRTGVPRAFRDYDDYAATLTQLGDAGGFDDYTSVWWDLRPHPQLGTVEVRAMDTQTSLRDALALIALVHCLAVHEGARPQDAGPSPEALAECCFRAMRDGRDAVVRFEGEMQPVLRIARTAVARVRPQALTLGCVDELEEVERIARDGTGADRQRRVHARAGMPALLRSLLVARAPRRERPARLAA